MIFRRRFHKLPKFPPSLIPTYRNLCVELPDESVSELRDEMVKVFASVQEESEDNPLFNHKLSRVVEKKCHFLLDRYGSLSSKHKKMVIGAVRYCAASDDSMSEQHFAIGTVDDARVINHVLEEIGALEEVIDLDHL